MKRIIFFTSLLFCSSTHAMLKKQSWVSFPLSIQTQAVRQSVIDENHNHELIVSLKTVCRTFRNILNNSCVENINIPTMTQREFELFLRAPQTMHDRVLSITGDSLLDDYMLNYLITLCPNVQTLDLFRCKNLNSAGLQNISRLGKHLINLTLPESCLLINIDHLNAIINACPQVEHLAWYYLQPGILTPPNIDHLEHLIHISMHANQNIDETTIKTLAQSCPHIQSVNITTQNQNSSIPSIKKNASIVHALALIPNLKHMALSSNCLSNPHVLSHLLKTHSRLNSLELHNQGPVNPPNSLIHIANLYNLSQIHLEGLRIDDEFMNAITLHCPLNSITLKNCIGTTPHTFAAIMHCGQRLTSLALCGFDTMIYAYHLLPHIMGSCSRIRTLELGAHTDPQQDAAALCILYLGAHLKNLHIYLHNTPEAQILVQELANHCPNIENLHIRGDLGISKQTFERMTELKKLTHINLSHCPALDRAMARHIIAQLPKLVSFSALVFWPPLKKHFFQHDFIDRISVYAISFPHIDISTRREI
ncbi:MAG: hypothetical protein UU47_C0003G0073 [candidate division TM6 bacterium GW2011_GWE2_41_16]|nr:MAG: hypothetical protein UU47_C0003G0073 [candidate division TM6 bacterium GW2011_GWE2_41_16]